MKAVVFGDVHGDAVQLKSLIQKAKGLYGPDVEFYSVGDLIDRGPDSKEVIQICIDEGVKAVRGNHEIWFAVLLSQGRFDEFALHKIMGGKATLLSYGLERGDLHGRTKGHVIRKVEQKIQSLVPQSHKDFILSLPLWRRIEVGDEVAWIMHGSAKREKMHELLQVYRDEEVAMHEYPPDAIVWPPTKQWEPRAIYAFEEGFQIFGHTPAEEPVIQGHYVALDTGCGTCHPYRLSGIVLPDMEIITS